MRFVSHENRREVKLYAERDFFNEKEVAQYLKNYFDITNKQFQKTETV